MNEAFSIQCVDGSDDDYYKRLQSQLRDYHVTQQINGPHDTFHFSLRVQGANSSIIGGLYALIYWGWLRIDLLWVHEDLRGQGLARQLIQQAEKIAQEHDCQRAYTQSWETALDFYLKCGYQQVGELVGYPRGHTYYTLRKDF